MQSRWNINPDLPAEQFSAGGFCDLVVQGPLNGTDEGGWREDCLWITVRLIRCMHTRKGICFQILRARTVGNSKLKLGEE